MGKEFRGMGKGLSAILGDGASLDDLRTPVGYVNKEIASDKGTQDTSDVLMVPADRIEPNPWQPRQSFDADALSELASSIRTFGLVQPLSVRRKGQGKYQIISGERRFRACTMIGMDPIPCFIRDATDQGMLEMAIVENIQRENLDPIETALSYQRLMDECSLTQEQMASRVGKKRSSIANSLRLLQLPPKVQHDLKVGLLSTGHAKVLLSVDEPALQEQLCDAVVRSGLSVRQLEDRVRALSRVKAPSASSSVSQELPDGYYRILECMGKYFSDNISLKRSPSGKGSMTVRFDSDEQMMRFLKALEDSEN